LDQASLILLDGFLNSYFDTLEYPPKKWKNMKSKKKIELLKNSVDKSNPVDLSQQFFNKTIKYEENENFRGSIPITILLFFLKKKHGVIFLLE